MKNFNMTGLDSPMEKINFMKSNADEVVPEYRYDRQLSDEEIAKEEEEFAQRSIALQDIEMRKSEAMRIFNEQIKEEKALAAKCLNLIRTGRMEVTEQVYIINDINRGKVYTYNQDGEVVAERNMRASERQYKIPLNAAEKDGTND